MSARCHHLGMESPPEGGADLLHRLSANLSFTSAAPLGILARFDGSLIVTNEQKGSKQAFREHECSIGTGQRQYRPSRSLAPTPAFQLAMMQLSAPAQAVRPEAWLHERVSTFAPPGVSQPPTTLSASALALALPAAPKLQEQLRSSNDDCSDSSMSSDTEISRQSSLDLQVCLSCPHPSCWLGS